MPKKSKDAHSASRTDAGARGKKTSRKQAPGKTTRPRKPTSAKPVPVLKPAPPSDEQIRLRAYFIAEKRARHSIKGDHDSDWLEARRQLFEEAGLPLH